MKQIALVVFLMVSVQLAAQQIITLYPAAVPNSKPNPMKEITDVENGNLVYVRNITQPTLTIYLPDKKIATGASVIICPGGGYGVECYHAEGTLIAEAFIKRGIAAFVLKYRLPSELIMIDKSIGPLQDAQQAIKTLRQRASEWQLDTAKIGIVGFSAGGHLASTAGTHFEKSYIPNDEKISLRPNFMILVYPVISMKDGLTHRGSRESLLGTSPEAERIALFSNELQVRPNTPPTWLTHAGDDNVVPVENSIRFYQELIRNHVPAEMHLYPSGNHGFVLNLPTDEWMQSMFSWMMKSGFIQ